MDLAIEAPSQAQILMEKTDQRLNDLAIAQEHDALNADTDAERRAHEGRAIAYRTAAAILLEEFNDLDK